MRKLFFKMTYILFTALLGGFIFSACSSSKLEDVWKDKQYNFGNVKNVVVISAFENNTQRMMWEDSFVKEFSNYGIKAVPSYKIYPNAIPKPGEVNKLIDGKYDGVVLIRRINNKTGNINTDDDDYKVPVGWVHYSFFNRYSKVYSQINTPGFFNKGELMKYNVGLYKTNTAGDLIWEGTGEIETPVSTNSLTKEFSNVVLPDMMGVKVTQG